MGRDAPAPALHALGQPLLRSGSTPWVAPGAGDALRSALGPGPFSLVVLFAAPDVDFDPLLATVSAHWPTAIVTGCTTAGEIAPGFGYTNDTILAVGFPTTHFMAEAILVEGLDGFNEQDVITQTIQARARLRNAAPHLDKEFGFLLVDGLSLSEDVLAATLSVGLGAMPMFGGSAGDGTRFDHTKVFWQGAALGDAAVFTMLRTNCDVRVFSIDHFRPTERRMVVTRADASRRIVFEINAEPAADELGRLLGRPPGQIDRFTFAESPMVVRIGDTHHVRAIKRVTPDGYLEFFSAIDEGMVLCLAEADAIAEHLRTELEALHRKEHPGAILACDCLLRRIEAEQKQTVRAVSDVLSDFHVAGFSTYGEQFGGLHVNQTMTGVALYPPKPAAVIDHA